LNSKHALSAPEQPENKKRRSRAKIILVALLCRLAFLALWAFVVEPSRLVLRETRISLPSWPANLKGLRIEPEVLASALKGLRARFGVFATLGNHDWWYNGPRVKKALENAGITELENDAVMIGRDGDAIWVVGIGDKWEGKPDTASALAKVSRGAPIIAFTHNPDIFPSIPARVG
jgi:hypothetical protein